MENNLTVAHKLSGSIITPEVKSLYKILSKLPSPKKEFNLTKDQRKCWYWIGKEFISTKKITLIDLIHLQNIAVMMDARNKILQHINKLNDADKENGTAGWVQIFKNKTSNVSGFQTMYEKATKQLDDASAHFGLSIRDRKKLSLNEKEDPNQLNFLEALQMLNNKAQ